MAANRCNIEGGCGFRSWDFLSWLSGWTVGGCRCFGAKVREQVLVFCSYGVKVRKQVLVCRRGDTFHLPGKWTLYLKVTPFDSNTPTHFNTKVPIGGICVAAKPPNSHAPPLLIIISLSPHNCFALNANDSYLLYSVAYLAVALYYHQSRL